MTPRDRIRVLFMISSMRGGGSEHQTLHLLREIDRDRFEPHLYLSEAVGGLLDLVPDDVVVHTDQTHERPLGLNYPGKILSRQSAGLTYLLEDHSIDVIYDRTFHMTIVAAPPATRQGVPRVSTIVSPPHHALPMLESKFVWLKKRRLAKAYREAFRVIAVSQSVADSAVPFYGIDSGELTVIPNPVPEIRVDDHFRLLSQDPAVTSLVCVGRMTVEKGHRELILALAEHERENTNAKIQVHLLGDGILRGEIESLAKCLTRHEVILHGHQTNPEDWIAVADGLILPSLFEGMPNVVLEAMKLRTPVIATRAGGTVELQRDKPTAFWADPGDVASLVSAIDEFAKDVPRRKTLANAAKQMVDSYHSLSRVTRQIESILEEAVSSRRERS